VFSVKYELKAKKTVASETGDFRSRRSRRWYKIQKLAVSELVLVNLSLAYGETQRRVQNVERHISNIRICINFLEYLQEYKILEK
jgi:hypothetical protein